MIVGANLLNRNPIIMTAESLKEEVQNLYYIIK